MSVPIKVAFAKTIRIGPFVDETDGHTLETGLTINQADIRLSKNGGNFVQKNETGGATHDENGWYSLALNGTDTSTMGSLIIAIDIAGALPLWREFAVWSSQVYNSFFSTDKLQVDVQEIIQSGQSAADLKDFVDAGYDPATNKVEGVKTVDILTGHTPQTGDSYGEIGTAGAGLTDLGGMSTGMRGEVQAEVDDALNAYDEAAGVASAAALDTVSGVVDAVLVDTDEMQGKLPTNNIMGSSVKTDKDDEIDAILVDTAEIGVAGVGLTDLGGMSSAMKAEVNAEVDTALDELIAEPVAGAPAVTCSVRTGMARVYGIARNKGTLNGTAGEKVYHNSSGVAISKKAVSDDGTTYEESAMTGV